MPRSLTRVTVDLEGTVRDYHTKRVKKAEAVGDQVDVEVDMRDITHWFRCKEIYDYRVHAAVCDEGDRVPDVTAYSVGLGQIPVLGICVTVPVQFYQQRKD